MTPPIRRLRMFAGPNGSGKSTLVRSLAKEFSPSGQFHLGYWINADEIEVELRTGRYDLGRYCRPDDSSTILSGLATSTRVGSHHPFVTSATISGGLLRCDPVTVNSYVAATIADLLRSILIRHGQSLSFETVMSHPSKIEFLRQARAANYRTYLYYVATETVSINLSRIETRVQLGEHAVPQTKVVERFARSLRLLPEAMSCASRAFLFDNSGVDPLCFAERTPAGEMQFRVSPEEIPKWFLKIMEHSS